MPFPRVAVKESSQREAITKAYYADEATCVKDMNMIWPVKKGLH